jgi:hypothetical protein
LILLLFTFIPALVENSFAWEPSLTGFHLPGIVGGIKDIDNVAFIVICLGC